MRFSRFVEDEQIAAFVDGIKFRETAVFGHFSADLDVVAAVQVSINPGKVVEFAFSVEQPYRKCGIAMALMDRALLWARNRGMSRAYVHCFSDNVAMRRVARHAGMEMTSERGETVAFVDLNSANPMSLFRESHAEGFGFVDFSVKALRIPLVKPSALLPAAT
jgi:RimJ/RimL family protein N-acetyltransferase